jgi:hypothetical protein
MNTDKSFANGNGASISNGPSTHNAPVPGYMRHWEYQQVTALNQTFWTLV